MSTLNLPPTIETTNPLSTLPNFSSVFRFNNRITALEKEVAELKKDPLHTQVTTLVDEHLDTRFGETKEDFMNFLSETLTTRIKEQVKDQLPQILPKEVSNFAPPVIETLIQESRDKFTLAKVSSHPHSIYEAATTLTEFELKKIFLDKMEKSESYMAAPKHRDCYDSLKKSYDLDKDFFFSYDVYSLKHGQKDKDKNEDPSAGSDRGLKKRKTSKDAKLTIGLKNKDSTSSSSKDPDMPQDQEGNLGDNDDEPRKETASRHDWFKKPTPPQEPTDPDWHHGKRQRVPFEYFINNDLKYLQGGVLTMTYTSSTTKSKAAQYDLPGIEDMVPNIWSPVKVAYDRYALRGNEETWIRNWLTNLLGDDVADFAIALRMFAKSLVIQKQVKDLQLGVKIYQKKINVTKPDTTRPDLRKRHPYAPYKGPQGFIYVDDYKRNKLMRSDELYKFSDGTLTRLLSSLEDITKNIDMEYLPKRR
ncbi:hypothetical protein Tco_0634924 [Tanacetum coccineum]